MNRDNQLLRIAAAQIAPVWLDRAATIDKVASYIQDAADRECDLVAFGEALVPGYPFWLERTDAARFNSKIQKRMFAHYLREGVVIERGDLDALAKLCRQRHIAVCLRVVERAPDRGGHSLYCSLVYVSNKGRIAAPHRKLVPTYEERLVWAPGDGHGMVTHSLGAFRVGALNCYENWIPLMRSALYGQGENLHIAAWPGGDHNTVDITRFIASESRSYVVSVAGVLRRDDIGDAIPVAEQLKSDAPQYLANGGSGIAAPTGKWLIEPVVRDERLIVAEIDHRSIREERHNFDLAGHYSRPDVTKLEINRTRQTTISFISPPPRTY